MLGKVVLACESSISSSTKKDEHEGFNASNVDVEGEMGCISSLKNRDNVFGVEKRVFSASSFSSQSNDVVGMAIGVCICLVLGESKEV